MVEKKEEWVRKEPRRFWNREVTLVATSCIFICVKFEIHLVLSIAGSGNFFIG